MLINTKPNFPQMFVFWICLQGLVYIQNVGQIFCRSPSRRISWRENVTITILSLISQHYCNSILTIPIVKMTSIVTPIAFAVSCHRTKILCSYQDDYTFQVPVIGEKIICEHWYEAVMFSLTSFISSCEPSVLFYRVTAYIIGGHYYANSTHGL